MRRVEGPVRLRLGPPRLVAGLVGDVAVGLRRLGWSDLTAALRVGQRCVLASPAFERVARPTLCDGRRHQPCGLAPLGHGLAGTLCAVVHTITGFTNRSLRAQVTTLLRCPVLTKPIDL